jgi:hypothetical protein
MPEGTLSVMTIPGQRITDLESSAWQTEKRLERIDATLGVVTGKLEQHGIALSDTMRDLRDLRIDVHGITKTLAGHTKTLAVHTAILTAIASRLEIPLPETEPGTEIDPVAAVAERP